MNIYLNCILNIPLKINIFILNVIVYGTKMKTEFICISIKNEGWQIIFWKITGGLLPKKVEYFCSRWSLIQYYFCALGQGSFAMIDVNYSFDTIYFVVIPSLHTAIF